MAGIGLRKTKITLNYLKEKPTRYKLAQLTFPQVTYEQLVQEVSQSRGVNTNQTRAVVDALLNRLIHYMEIGHGVSLGDFGSFKPGITVKAVKDPENVDEESIKVKKVRFYPGGSFQRMLKSLGTSTYDVVQFAEKDSQLGE